MIKLKLITEGRYDYGCIMAKVREDEAQKILEFNYKMIEENVLFTEGYNLGREKDPHITIKYGLTKSYSPTQIQDIIRGRKPFMVEIRGINIFENDEYDVVKFDVDGKELRELNQVFSKLPNEDEHPEYHPHMTLAYVKKGHGDKYKKSIGKIAKVPITEIIYSDKGDKSRYRLGYDDKD